MIEVKRYDEEHTEVTMEFKTSDTALVEMTMAVTTWLSMMESDYGIGNGEALFSLLLGTSMIGDSEEGVNLNLKSKEINDAITKAGFFILEGEIDVREECSGERMVDFAERKSKRDGKVNS